MIREKEAVRRELHRRVLQGYNPRYDCESACDHNADWLVLSRDEFENIKGCAMTERARLQSRGERQS